MLTEAQLELITAAVDDSLSPQEKGLFQRLIAESLEADLLYRQMLADRMALQTVPRVRTPKHLSENVLAQLDYPAIPTSVRPRRAVRKSFWWHQAVAASLFLAVTITACSLFLYQSRREATVAQLEWKRLPNALDHATKSPQPSAVVPSPRSASPEPIPAPRPAARTTPPAIAMVKPIESAPLPRVLGLGHDVVGSATLTEVPPFETIELRLPYLADFSAIGEAPFQQELRDRVKDHTPHRLDLFSRDLARSLQQFKSAAKAAKVSLLVDSVAQERLNKKMPTAWLIYTEALTPDDLSKLTTELARVVKAETTQTFTVAHLVPAQTADARELRSLLGVDPGLWKRPPTPRDDSPKSISEDTVDQVASSLLKQKPKTALVLTYWPHIGRANPAMSKEVRSFLNQRNPRDETKIPFIFVLRPAM